MLHRSNSGTSEFSMYSKSQRTALTFDTVTDGGTTVVEGGNSDIGSHGEKNTNFTMGVTNDPIIVGLGGMFNDIFEDIINKGQQRINFHKRLHKGFVGSDEDGMSDIHNLVDDQDNTIQANTLQHMLDDMDVPETKKTK